MKMVVRVTAQELFLPLPPLPLLSLNSHANPNLNPSFPFSIGTSTLSLSNLRRTRLSLPPSSLPRRHRFSRLSSSPGNSAASVIVEHAEEVSVENEAFEFERNSAAVEEMKKLSSAEVEVKELGDLPEEWRRARLAWLCKELPPHKSTTVKVLNGQRKWMRQEDATYVAVHCMRIRENEAAFRVYKWMMQQSWFRFDFALATKLADYLGRDRKYSKCREVFDDIINQGRVPSESTFHILIVAYLSAPVQGCLDEACSIYNRMIQLGGYQPRLSLHNSLFKALVSKPGISSKHYLNQAEFIYHQLVTSGLEVHKDIYGGLIWLHSYQDTIDMERIEASREEMLRDGIEEGREVLMSVLRAYAREGRVEEAEKTWFKLLQFKSSPLHQAFVYKMEVYSKVGMPMKSLEIFREMQEKIGNPNVAAYNKIIEILCKAKELDYAESIMADFVSSGLKPLTPSYVYLLNMYFNLELHDRLEEAFSQCLERCHPNCTVYSIYLDSLVEVGDTEKAEDIFNLMNRDMTIGVTGQSCNSILRGYLSSGNYSKAEKLYDFMCVKKYEIEAPLMEKHDYVLSLSKKVVKKPISLKLTREQREILIGLLLGGLRIEPDDRRKDHIILFDFDGNSNSLHYALKSHIHRHFYEWIHPSYKPIEEHENIPDQFFTIASSHFSFFADQFWSKGQPTIPKLAHRWLSACVLAYWYMYGGIQNSSGDILLKIKGSREGVESIVKKFKVMSMDCKVKRKGRVYWIGFFGSNATCFWKLVQPYVLEDLRIFPEAGERDSIENENINCYSDSD